MRALVKAIKPGWIALVMVVAAFATACFMVLAPWQLGKNESTSERNNLIKAAVATAPVPINEVAPPRSGFAPKTEWREVTVTGTYLVDKQALVRLRSVDERPAIEVLTPFQVAGSDRVLLVDRGYVRPDQSNAPTIAAPPTSQTTITARIRAAEGTSEGRGTRVENGALTAYTIDPVDLSHATNLQLDPFYLQLSPKQPGSLGEIALPQLDSGPYLSYGLQWLAFGIMAPLGVGYFIFSEIRQRRRAAAVRAADAAAEAAGADGDPATGDATDPQQRSPASAEHRPAALNTRNQRRKRIRDELRQAGSDTDIDDVQAPSQSAPAGIDAGPDTGNASSKIREKLTDRYGN